MSSAMRRRLRIWRYAPRIARAVEAEATLWVSALGGRACLDDRQRGHLEAMRHILTVIEVARGRGRR